jgi:glutamate-1-semialdehyde 2,1-aminomutase
VLTHLKQHGASLQQQLNQRTTEFVQTLNTYFAEDNIPIRMANFGSLFDSASSESATLAENSYTAGNMSLLYYHMLDRGVLLLRGGGYLSTAHTDADLDAILQAVKSSVQELRDTGFLPR